MVGEWRDSTLAIIGAGDQAEKCDAASLASHTTAIHSECCGTDDAACNDGKPTSCDAGCAATFLPFWAECAEKVQWGDMSGVVALCGGVPEHAVAVCECDTYYHGNQCDVCIDDTGGETYPRYNGSSPYANCTDTPCPEHFSGPNCETLCCSRCDDSFRKCNLESDADCYWPSAWSSEGPCSCGDDCHDGAWCCQGCDHSC